MSIKTLTKRQSNKQYTIATEADVEYQRLLNEGIDIKTAAKQAQFKTGLSLITGKPMKTRGYYNG